MRNITEEEFFEHARNTGDHLAEIDNDIDEMREEIKDLQRAVRFLITEYVLNQPTSSNARGTDYIEEIFDKTKRELLNLYDADSGEIEYDIDMENGNIKFDLTITINT